MIRAKSKKLRLEAKETIVLRDTMAPDILDWIQLGYTTIFTLSEVLSSHIKRLPFQTNYDGRICCSSILKKDLKTSVARPILCKGQLFRWYRRHDGSTRLLLQIANG